MLSLSAVWGGRRGSALKRRGALRQGSRPRSQGRRLRFETVEERRLLSISLGALANKAVAEGSPYSDAIAIVDPGASSYTASVNYGDGTVDNSPTLLNVGGDELLVLDHIYGQTGAYNVTASVQDNLNQNATSDTAAITVSEAPATLSGLPTSANQGWPASFTESFTDPGWGVQYAYSVSWGDGSSADTGAATIDVSGQAHTPTQGHFDLSHTYSATGTYTATASLYEVDNGVECGTPIAWDTESVTVVERNATTTTLSASDVSAAYGEAVTLTASVAASAPGAGTPTGTVAFMDGTTPVGTATVDGNGDASIQVTAGTLGFHQLTAAYLGDAQSATSGSSAVAICVYQAPTTVTLGQPTVTAPGATATLTATVAASTAGGAAPTGVVVFYAGENSIGSATVGADGTASIQYAPLEWSSAQPLYASYMGDQNHAGASSPQITLFPLYISDLGGGGIGTYDISNNENYVLNATMNVIDPNPGATTWYVSFDYGDGTCGSATYYSAGTIAYQHQYTSDFAGGQVTGSVTDNLGAIQYFGVLVYSFTSYC